MGESQNEECLSGQFPRITERVAPEIEKCAKEGEVTSREFPAFLTQSIWAFEPINCWQWSGFFRQLKEIRKW